MKTFEYFTKRALFALFVLSSFSSCCPRIPSWYYESDCYGTFYRYSKLVYSETNICKNLELEIIRTSSELCMYINVLSIPIDQCKDPDSLDLVKCIVNFTEDSSIEFDVARLEGGQRFKVPEDALNAILDHLWAGGMINIRLGRYTGQITGCNFQKAYRTLLF